MSPESGIISVAYRSLGLASIVVDPTPRKITFGLKTLPGVPVHLYIRDSVAVSVSQAEYRVLLCAICELVVNEGAIIDACCNPRTTKFIRHIRSRENRSLTVLELEFDADYSVERNIDSVQDSRSLRIRQSAKPQWPWRVQDKARSQLGLVPCN